MAVFKCKMCGGDLEIAEGASVAECQYCGSKQTLPRFDSERKANLYDRANHFRRNNEYDKAESIYELILNEDATDAEAYWSLVLCRYGIEYVEDPATHKRLPTVNRAQYTSVFADENYKKAVEYAALTGKETVLDAYCGIGTIGIAASDKARQIVGVELEREAVKDAIANARLNGLRNCWYSAGDAGAYMEQMVRDGLRPDVVFLDPPRAGSDERFLRSLLRSAPGRVIYVSCDPETLARDLKILNAGGYRVEKIQPVDMFPYTEHVETVVALKRPSP